MFNLSKYATTDENSLYKGIPVAYRYHPTVRELMKSRLFSVRYRGGSKPGYNRPQSYCHKDMAETFAIYPYSNYKEYTDLKVAYLNEYSWKVGFDKLHDHLKNVAKGLTLGLSF